MGAPYVHAHKVRFEEVDAAGIVYFARVFTWCHDAMDEMFSALDGGYQGLVIGRRLGFPVVHVDADYRSPVRFGEVVRVAITTEKIGRSAVTLRFDLTQAATGADVATVRHVVAMTDLAAMRSTPVVDDVRAVLERHAGP